MSDPIDPSVRSEIEQRLSTIEWKETVRFLLAVESGSRAWGFPSPDSDYDVRFIYVRPRDWYLALDSRRDVIETPIIDEIDLNGWDVRKALGLLLKSNAVVNEWIESPIRYRPDDPAITRFVELADALFNPRATGLHYARLGQSAAERWLDNDEPVPVKKYFYSLRPALAIRALRDKPVARPAMNLQRLIASADVPPALVAIIDDLVEAKRRTNELSNGARVPELDTFIRSELERAGELPAIKPKIDPFVEANALFLSLLD